MARTGTAARPTSLPILQCASLTGGLIFCLFACLFRTVFHHVPTQETRHCFLSCTVGPHFLSIPHLTFGDLYFSFSFLAPSFYQCLFHLTLFQTHCFLEPCHIFHIWLYQAHICTCQQPTEAEQQLPSGARK